MHPRLLFLSLIAYAFLRDLVFRELFVFVEEVRMPDPIQGWKSRVSLCLQLFDLLNIETIYIISGCHQTSNN